MSGNGFNKTSFHFQSPSIDSEIQEVVSDSFYNSDFDGLRVMMATISENGINKFQEDLESFCQSERSLNILVGTGMAPDPTAIRRLRDLRDEWPELVNLKLVQTSDNQHLFHPKLYWFHGNKHHRLFTGSANWTGRGFSTNIEAITETEFTVDPSNPPELLQDLNSGWTDVHESCRSEDGWGELIDPTDEVISQLETNWEENQGASEITTDIETRRDSGEEGVWPLSGVQKELVMDLTMEQGGNRVSQVQPPLTVWREFFDIEPEGEQPEYIIKDVRTGDKYRFGVVGHDHNWTIEIPGARVSRPALIVMRLESEHELKYAVYTYNDAEYDELDQFLSDNGEIPHPMQERRQYINDQ